MKRGVVVALAAAALATGASAAVSPTTKSFQDAIGEDPAGPDITTVVASSDGDGLTIRVSIPTNPTVTPDFRLRVWLDADDSLETGLTFEDGPTGLDHFILVDPTRFRPDEAGLYGCTGETNVCGPQSSVDFSYASGATFTTDARSLALKKIERLRFSVTATTGIVFGPATGYDFTNAHFDFAPDAPEELGVQPTWTFVAQPVRVTAFRITPAQPKAGKPLRLALHVVDDETGSPLASGKVTCLLLSQGARLLARARHLAGGVATCTFAVPRTSAGKRFRATVRVTAKGTTVGRALTGRFR